MIKFNLIVCSLLMTLAFGHAWAGELAAVSRQLATCYMKSSTGPIPDFVISQVGPTGLLPAGFYIQFPKPAWAHDTLFKVRSGESSLRDLIAQIKAGNPSYDGVRFTAVGIEPTTTQDHRGEEALIVEGKRVSVGDSFFRPNETLGKFFETYISFCN